VFYLDTIKVQFNSIDEAENAIVSLKDIFTFSYSFMETNLNSINFNDYINSTVYSSISFPYLNQALNFPAYPSHGFLNNEVTFEKNKTIIRIKCSLDETDAIIAQLWNLGAESVKEV
jgi:hypothetical protein